MRVTSIESGRAIRHIDGSLDVSLHPDCRILQCGSGCLSLFKHTPPSKPKEQVRSDRACLPGWWLLAVLIASRVGWLCMEPEVDGLPCGPMEERSGTCERGGDIDRGWTAIRLLKPARSSS